MAKFIFEVSDEVVRSIAIVGTFGLTDQNGLNEMKTCADEICNNGEFKISIEPCISPKEHGAIVSLVQMALHQKREAKEIQELMSVAEINSKTADLFRSSLASGATIKFWNKDCITALEIVESNEDGSFLCGIIGRDGEVHKENLRIDTIISFAKSNLLYMDPEKEGAQRFFNQLDADLRKQGIDTGNTFLLAGIYEQAFDNRLRQNVIERDRSNNKSE